MNWTNEWPTTPGWYWFYGWATSGHNIREPELHMVKVRGIRNGLAYICDGHFMFQESTEGLFLKAEPPILPVLYVQGEQRGAFIAEAGSKESKK